MVSLAVNFFADAAVLASLQLGRWGHLADPSASPRDIIALLENLGRRRIEPQRRRVHLADGLDVPEALQPGFDLVRRTAENGGDLNLHLSSTVQRNAAYRDQMLSDWGMHHLHLGTTIDHKTGMIARTRELLFAIVRDDDIYFVGFGEHAEPGTLGDWTRRALIAAAYRSWPALYRGQVMRSLPAPNQFTEEQHNELRRAGVLLAVQVDGVVLFPLGGGYATDRSSLAVTSAVQRVQLDMRNLEQRFAHMTDEIVQLAIENGVDPATFDFHVKGRDSHGRWLVADDKAGIRVFLALDAVHE